MRFYLFIILIAFTSTIVGQENAPILLDEYIKAIGGQNNIDRIQSIYSFANCNGPNGAYQTEVHSAKNSKSIFRQIRKDKPDYIGIVNGNTFWTKGAEVAIAEKKSAYVWRSHEIQWMAIRLNERFREIKFIGNVDFVGKQAVKFSAIDELNKTAQLYFDKTTNLLLGIVIFNPFSEEAETIRLEINDWKRVGKLLLPSQVTFIDKQGKFELKFQSIKINMIKLSVFDIPEKIIAIKKLMELHDLQRTAHFNRDAKLLVSIMSEKFLEIRNGKITSPKKDELIKRFQGYFDSVTFIEWEDKQSPIIEVSEDLKMAVIHVTKKVRLITKGGNEELTNYAWSATFEKINDHWQMKSMTSTSEK